MVNALKSRLRRLKVNIERERPRTKGIKMKTPVC
jgi:hypothetical protein